MGKHAYLIMCHNNFRILKKLVKLLDDPRNDIYIHVDRKVKQFSEWRNDLSVEKASLTFTNRISVNWGGFSQIEAELELLKEATKSQHDYYHLISGVDLPLKHQDQIHEFFTLHKGCEFIGIDECSEGGSAFESRISYYHFFQDTIGRNPGLHIAILERIENLLLQLQRILKINRLCAISGNVYKGAQWFSITHAMAEYVLLNEPKIRKMFSYGLCVDELFLQTMAMASPYAGNIVNDTQRHIDWNRGTPYTFRSLDYDELMESGKLFARKFDESTDMEIVERIYANIVNYTKEGW